MHLNDPAFEGDLEFVVERALERGVKGFLIVGYDLKSSERAVKLAEYLPWSYAAVGIHPHEAQNFNDDVLKELEELAKAERVKAIGETGLDFYRNLSPENAQYKAFEAQLELAKSLDLPVVVHTRKSFNQAADVIEKIGHKKGVFHSFSHGTKEAQRAIELGFYISISALITYGARKLAKAIKETPEDRLLVETDAPFLPPAELKNERNEPAYIIFTVEKIAEILGRKPAEVARKTTYNALRFLGLENLIDFFEER